MSLWPVKNESADAARSAPSDDDVLDEIVADCVERGSTEVDTRLDAACREYPHLANALRRRIESLREVGLLRDEPLAVDERFPERLGEFRLIERLGSGGMGVVFRARQPSLDRDVALKLIRPDQLYFPRARERFRREIEAVARLQHPGIVPIYAVGDEGGMPYFAMELLPGSTLADVLRALLPTAPERLAGGDLLSALLRCVPVASRPSGRPSAKLFAGSYVDAVVGLVVQVAEALDHAHARDVLHRDVKPSNIAVTLDGRALLFDFGLASLADGAARLTATSAEVGSLHYMSPEQLRGDSSRVGPRADVYALGVTLYEMLALQPPYAERDVLETRRAILEGRRDSLRARNRAVARDLELVCSKAMELDPALRYASASEFAADLRNVIEHRPIHATSPSALVVASRWMRRHRATSTALAASVLIAVGLPTTLLVQSNRYAVRLERERDEARVQRELAVAAKSDATAQRDIARQESTTAKEVNDFLLGVFGSVDPSRAQGQDVKARQLLDDAAERLKTELADQPLVRARLLNALGHSYASLGVWERARETLESAQALCEANGQERSRTMAEVLDGLAGLDRELHRPTALENARRAVELYRELSTEPSFEFAELLVGFGGALTEADRLDEAEEIFGEALGELDRLPTPHESGRAGVLVNLAQVQFRRNEFEDALESARTAIELQREVADAHPAISSALNLAALSLTKLGRFDEAREAYAQVLDLERQLTGEESTRYASFLASKSHVEMATGRVAQAIELLERAADVFTRVAPPTHEGAVTIRALLGSAYMRAARWRDGRDVFESLLRDLASSEGLSGARALASSVKSARCAEALGQWDAMEAELTQVLERCSDAGAAENDLVEAQGALDLARCLAHRGEAAAAGELVARAVALRGETSIESAFGAWLQFTRGVVALSAGDKLAARAALADLAAVERGPTGAEWIPAAARARLASALAPDEAERARELIELAHGELVNLIGPTHPEVTAAEQVQASLRER